MRYVAYTDGSYKELPGLGAVYASAAILAPEGTNEWKVFSKVCQDEYLAHRNVAGEIFAVLMVCEHLLKSEDCKCDHLTIHYDYEGVEKWITGDWSANKKLTRLYKDYMHRYALQKFDIDFVWVKGHNGDEGNEIVDSMCRDAISEWAKKNGGQ